MRTYPFTAVVGSDDMALALARCAVSSAVDGCRFYGAPDDPATGRAVQNLDPHLVGVDRLVPLLLPGAMTPEPAEIDISSASRPIAATVPGLASFDPSVRIAGMHQNEAGSRRHSTQVTDALEATGIPALGVRHRDDGIAARNRHLGLVPAQERDDARAALGRLAGTPWNPAQEMVSVSALGVGPAWIRIPVREPAISPRLPGNDGPDERSGRRDVTASVDALRVDLPVAGRRVVVVGGGVVALGRIAALRAARAQVVVFSPDPVASVGDFADRDLITLHQRAVTAADLTEAWLVFAATGDPVADQEITDSAAAVGRFCLTGTGLRASEPVGRGKLGGRVVLVGGGPGDPGLLTLTGLTAIQEADVVIADRLAPLAVLQHVRPGTEIIDVAKIPRGNFTSQEEINRLLIAHASAGKSVVRLKGGDNFVFGRGGEEWQACAAAGIEVQLVPGVSSALAAPALAGIPVTHRSLNQGFTVVSGHVPPGDPRSTLDWAALARTGTALVVMMGVANLAAISAALVAGGLDPTTPAATVSNAGHPGQATARATVADIAQVTEAAGLAAPAVTVIGSVAGFDPLVPE